MAVNSILFKLQLTMEKRLLENIVDKEQVQDCTLACTPTCTRNQHQSVSGCVLLSYNFEPSKDAPFPFIVKSNEAKLIFKSDKEEQKSGFALT